MTSTDPLAADREAFREHANASGEQIKHGNSDAANDHTEQGDAIVTRCANQDQVHELLLPLLEDPSPDVRFAAAAHLLNHGAADRALPVLEALDRNREGSSGLAARLLVRRWRNHTNTSA